MINIVQDRYIPCHLAAKGRSNSHYSVQVDGTTVFRGTLADCKAKRNELMQRHPYTTNGMTQMEGFKRHFIEKRYH